MSFPQRTMLIILCTFMLISCSAGDTGQPDGVMYFILIDRFADGDSSNNTGSNPASYLPYDGSNPEALKHYQGGDLKGITENLDRLAEMGITMLWISPFLDNSNTDYVGWWPYHGYHPIDFYAVDEHFGELADLQELVAQAHVREMKVIFDMPFNQTAADHPWLDDKEKQDWFHFDEDGEPYAITDWFDQDQIERGELHGLPDLAQENPEVAQYLIDVSKYWIETTACDGFRLDAVKHIPIDFWREYNREIKAIAGEEFLLLGEVFWGDADLIEPYVDLGFDMLFHIPGYYAIRNTFNKGGSFKDFSNFYQSTSRMLEPQSLATIIDNHDVARFNVGLEEDAWEKQRLALGWLITSPGMPVIYSGTELGMQGYPPLSATGVPQDFLNRKPYPVELTGSMEKKVQEFSTLLELRSEHTSLARGAFHEIYKDWSVYAFLRSYNNETTLVLLNNATTEEFVAITPPEVLRQISPDKIYGEAVLRQEGDNWYFRIPPNSMALWLFERSIPAHLPTWTQFTDRLSADYKRRLLFYHDPEHNVARIQLAGDFNNWTATDYPSFRSADTIYMELPLKQGSYEYKLVLNGEMWIADPNATETTLDPYGGKNGILVVGE
ncbi:MAG: hypothetical protein K9M49_02655 [Candidatus Marinimicrobia bacterium]|nr:hypothetical protein [Candidatus Neomarinimicrobiota bacterium]MCF7851064.1 hypothetical protein [Candidatus Neomarinimicrobiota bacterium]MCF7904034.1 hypothetical protein [Candidatus Neomarinimicrobiota bacterium]